MFSRRKSLDNEMCMVKKNMREITVNDSDAAEVIPIFQIEQR